MFFNVEMIERELEGLKPGRVVYMGSKRLCQHACVCVCVCVCVYGRMKGWCMRCEKRINTRYRERVANGCVKKLVAGEVCAEQGVSTDTK